MKKTTGNEAANLSYDADGNLTFDGTWSYSYDGENRLYKATSGSISIYHTYDYVGRRVRKVKWVGVVPTSTSTYVYDGWNLLAELDQSKNPQRTYTWGPDATGAIGGGGTGGLLMISSGGSRWYPVYDGRHNITALLDQNGTTVAAYAYDTFGRITGQAGSQAANNPFGFATQFTDRDTGLVYFGHRFYHPRLGRFVNRDPIGEAGGLNLYAYAGNDAVNRFDVLGLEGDDREVDLTWGNPFFAGSARRLQAWLDELHIAAQNIVRIEQSKAAAEANQAQRGELTRTGVYATPESVQESNNATGSRINDSGVAANKGPTASDIVWPGRRPTPIQDIFWENGMIPPDLARMADQLGISWETAQAIQTLANLGLGAGMVVLSVYYPPLGTAIAVAVLINPNSTKLDRGLAAAGLGLGTAVRIIRILPSMVNDATVASRLGAGEIQASLKISAVTGEPSGGAMITVLGSRAGTAAYKGIRGFNVFQPSAGLTAEEIAAANRAFINEALARGDTVWLVTNPETHQSLMISIGRSSAYLDLEIPMLQSTRATATPVFQIATP